MMVDIIIALREGDGFSVPEMNILPTLQMSVVGVSAALTTHSKKRVHRDSASEKHYLFLISQPAHNMEYCSF